ncbi:acetoin utilization AcuB family protein [Evansella clarkii]|uniref:acetoin utilization AcuB family protein n=1 Tax=Evansella clarkii TaxID=79879 RepID=UPI0009976F1C|nr:acetoin utilization AcuB family protein [Evansella clarkii]
MKIKDIMIKNVISAKPELAIKDALQIMKENKIRHLPVVNEENSVIGIISDRDLKDASPSVFAADQKELLEKPVSEVMITDVLTAFTNDFVEEAAHMMTENQISCLPIEKNGKLSGIITETDLLHTLVRLTGADAPSSRLELEVPNRSGMLSDVAAIIKDHKINIQSVLVYPSNDQTKKILVFRLRSMDLRMLIQSLKESDYAVLWPEQLGMRT